MRLLSALIVVASSSWAAAAHAETLSACEQTVEYKLQPPNSPTASTFSGVWVGKWDTGLCGAVVVESIEANGTARLLYLNGSIGGQYSTKAGNRRFPGKIEGNKLTASGNNVTIEYVQSGPTELAGTFTNRYGSFKGTFRKQQ